MRIPFLFAITLLAGLLGCDTKSAPATATPASTSPPPPPGPRPLVQTLTPAAPQPTETRVAADQMLGVNAPNQKGADYAWSYSRVLFTNYFGVQETVALGQVKQALEIYEVNHGHKPKTSEEGMEAIKLVPLPELPDDTYWYEFDPQEQQLIVVHKEPAPAK